MKKSLIVLGVLVIAALALPIIGNSVMQNSVDKRVAELQSYGVESKAAQTQSNYLYTKRHFEFALKDADAFIAYLNKYADNQIPPYANALFEGVVLGVDLEYSNIPFMSALSLDIYPMGLSKSMQNSLSGENPRFFAFMKSFLESGGILYHINYNIATQKFDGYVKDIDENQTLEAQTRLELTLLDFTFEGKGDLLAPSRLASSVKKLQLSFTKEQENFLFALEDFTSKNSSDSKSNYNSEFSFEKFDFIVNELQNNVAFSVRHAALSASSEVKEKLAKIASKSAMEEMKLLSKDLEIKISKLELAAMILGLEAVSYEALLEIISKINKSDDMMDPLLADEMQKSLGTLLSHGLLFNIEEFSAQNIAFKKDKSLGGFDVKSEMKLLADPDFMKKLELSPLLLASNIEANSKIKLSKKLYEFSLEGEAKELANTYLKEDGDSYVFDIAYKDAQATVNNKPLR